MIYVKVEHSSDKLTVEFKGHAGYDEPGKDIVCAGISAIALLVANVCNELNGSTDMRDGFAKYIFDEGVQAERFSGVLLDTLYLMAMRYTDYLTVEEVYNEG